MKKLIFGGILVGSVALNIYLINTEVIVKNDLDSDFMEMNDEITIAQSAVKKPRIVIKNHKKNIEKISKDLMPEKVSEASDASEYTEDRYPVDDQDQYQKSKEVWKENVTSFLDLDLKLDVEQIESYFKLEKQREMEISSFMSPKIGEENDGPYLFTVEDNVALGKINEKYLKKLKISFGDEAYTQYIKFRQNTNKKLIKSGDSHYFAEF
ncbi:MAG: hypothetical protein ACJAS4_000987 [Bacteriovoracaceae bacterium]|jgi:hypothetical protein